MSTEQSQDSAAPADRANGGPAQGEEDKAHARPRQAGAREPQDDQEPVPRLPRGRGLSLSVPEILRILMFTALLVAVITLRQPCASSAGKFINAFEPPPDAGPTQVQPGGDMLPGHYIHLTPDMSEDEIRRAIDQVAGDQVAGDQRAGASQREPDRIRDAGPVPPALQDAASRARADD